MKIKNPLKVKSEGLLIILCGLPSSGKSCFAEKLKSSFNLSEFSISNIRDIIVVDTDSIRKENFGSDFDFKNESEVRALSIKSVKKSLKGGRIVISDDINYFTSMRHEFVELADNLKKPYFIIHISTPLPQCLDWNSKRDNPIEEEIIKGIADKFDIPGKKYKWDKPFISVNLQTEKLDLTAINSAKKIESIYLEKFGIIEKQEKSEKSKKNAPKKLPTEEITRSIIGIYSDYVFQGESFQILNNQKSYDPLKKTILKCITSDIEVYDLFLEVFEIYGDSIESVNRKRKKFKINLDKANMDLQQIIFEFLYHLLQN